jgi:hypothetical protein
VSVGEEQLESPTVHATGRRVIVVLLVLLGAAAAITLAGVGVGLLTQMHGSECHGEFPVCTTPSQQSARLTIGLLCAVGVLAYLMAARPAFRVERFSWAHIVVGIVIVLAILALLTHPTAHLSSEAGSGQWFRTG